jgi:hypothetical protein
MPKSFYGVTFVICLAIAGLARAEDAVFHTNIEKTDVNLFVPDGLKSIRGILINPADKSVGGGTVWGECCRHWGMVHMGIMLENVDKRNNRPNTLRKVIDEALKQFAVESKHPDLVNAPFLFGGMSKGGGWSAELGQGFAGRTIAFNNVCGWVGKPDADISMPAVFVIGGIPDGFKMLDSIATQYEPARQKGAAWCMAIQWGNGHNYGNANALAMPFLDSVINARLPNGADGDKNPGHLAKIKLDDGWLGDRRTWGTNNATIAAYADYQGDKEVAAWLPNRYTAHVWRSFVSNDPPVQLHAESEDGKYVLAPFKPANKRFLVVPDGQSLNLNPEIRVGTTLQKIAFFDGDALVGEAMEPPYQIVWRHIPPGPRSIFIEYVTADGSTGFSNPALIVTTPKTKAPAE